MAKDPVCGMNVDEKKAAGSSAYSGKTYYFCCSHCKVEFDKNPAKYVRQIHENFGLSDPCGHASTEGRRPWVGIGRSQASTEHCGGISGRVQLDSK